MMNPAFLNGVKTLANHDLTYDILIYERQLEEAVTFIQSLPEMRIVIDHIAKPNIKEKSFDHWANYMSKIASMDHVSVKLSGMVTEADWNQWTKSDIQRYVDFCLEHFGAKRLMYGTDWPVCLLAGTYSEVYGLLNECISQLSNNERKQILGLNAIDFYQLNK
jgi:L-fuconolactonase